MKGVNVRFLNGVSKKNYRFLTNIEDLEKGDLVVVDANNSYHLAKVVGYVTHYEPNDKWIIQKIDLTEHNKRIDDKKRKIELKSILDKELDKYKDLVMYDLIAKENKELKCIVEEYKKLI